MQLSQEAIEEFKAIYKREYGREISDAEAREKGARLLRVFMILLEPEGNAEIPEDTQTPSEDSWGFPPV